MDTIGEKIRIRRLTKNYSQEYMAFMLDISQAAYPKIERGETVLTLPRVYEIAEILQVSPFSFMPKPKFGTSIAITYYKTLAKLRRFWRKSFQSSLEERKQAYHQSKGQ